MAVNEFGTPVWKRLVEFGRGGLSAASRALVGTQEAPGPLGYMAQGAAEGIGSGMSAIEAVRNVTLPGTAARNVGMPPMQRTWESQPGYPKFQLDPASPYHPLYSAAKVAPAAAMFAPASLGAGIGGLAVDVGGALIGAGGADVARQQGASQGVQDAIDVAGNMAGPGVITSLAAAPVALAKRAGRGALRSSATVAAKEAADPGGVRVVSAVINARGLDGNIVQFEGPTHGHAAMAAEDAGYSPLLMGVGSGDAGLFKLSNGEVVDRRWASILSGADSDAAERMGLGSAPLGRLEQKTKRVADMSMREMHEYGLRHGVPNLAPSDEALWRNGMEEVVGTDGAIYTIPGGAKGTEPFTYYDLLHLKQQGINPNKLPHGLHRSIHDRIIKTMQGDGNPSDIQIANQMIFSLMSANNPLTPNELGLQRMMIKSPEDLERLGASIPWRYSDNNAQIIEKAMATPEADGIRELARDAAIKKKNAPEDIAETFDFDNLSNGEKVKAIRNYYSNMIVNQRGLQAKKQGGIGATGSLNYTFPAEFAQMMKDRPDFFRFNPERYPGMTPDEQWQTFVNELATQVRGLQAKTASFGAVWQSTENARISAVDRWMAKLGLDDMFPSPEEKLEWTDNMLAQFNAERGTNVQTIAELEKTRGGPGYLSEMALAYASAARTARRTLKVKGKKGAYGPEQWNPAVPKHYQTTPWVYPPENMVMANQGYEAAVKAQARVAEGLGHHIFPHQWFVWDKARQRLEPHEIMFPGLEKLPPMPLDEIKEVTSRHAKAGYMKNLGPVKPIQGSPSGVAYWSLPLAGAGGLGNVSMTRQDEDLKRKKGRGGLSK